jgi:WD40 repeat protein
MAVLRVCLAVALILLAGGFGARAEDVTPPGLYDTPVLVIDPGMHTAMISSAAVDRDGRWAMTGSLDKTIRVWSLADGRLVRTIRLPAGPGWRSVRTARCSPPAGGPGPLPARTRSICSTAKAGR